MGADMIGISVFGPLKLSKRNKKKAIAEAQKVIAAAQDIVKLSEQGDTPYDDWDEFDLLGESMEFHEIERLADTEAADIVESFYKFWSGEDWYRDSYESWDSKTDRKVVFAGDMSWGDEPDGSGYQLLWIVRRLRFIEHLDCN